MQKKITVKLLEGLPAVGPKEPEIKIHDPSRPGLFLRKRGNAKGGSVSLWCHYRTATGAQRRVKLADWPGLSLEKAIQKWMEVTGALADGRDIAQEKALDRARPIKTVADLWQAFAERKGIPTTETKPGPGDFGGPLKEKTALNYWMDWKNHLGPEFGEVPLASLSRSHVTRWHHDHRATPGAANHALRVLRSLLNWGVEEEHLDLNPSLRIKEHKLPERGRLLTIEERGALLAAIEFEEALALERAGKERTGARANRARKYAPHALSLIKLLLFLGLRLREMQFARWEDVSFEERTLSLADTKTGPREVDLPEAALDVLRDLHARRRCDWIIENAEGTGPLNNCRKAWARVLERAGLPHLRIHDLRHARVSELFEAGLDPGTIGELTGQRNPATVQRYRHTNRQARRAALEKAEAFRRSREGRPPAKVEEIGEG